MKPLIAFCFAITLGLTGCQVVQRDQGTSAEPASPLIEAQGWQSLTWRAYGSELILQGTGHFYVRPNACYHREYGTLQLEIWNRAAGIINEALERRQRLDDGTPRTCLPRDPGLPALYDGAELELFDGTKLLLVDEGGSRACGIFGSDAASMQAMRELVDLLGEIARIARAEGC